MRHLYIRAILCDVDPGTKIGDAIVAGIAIATRNGAPVTFAHGNVAVTVLPNMAEELARKLYDQARAISVDPKRGTAA